jgi:hypothetical protein
VAAVAAATALLGCDQGTPALSAGGKGPAPQVVWKYPDNEAKGVPSPTTVRVQFDRFLAPDSAVRQAICIQACSVGPGAQCAGQCLGNLVPEYDPVDRVAVWKNVQVQPGIRYNVRLLVPVTDDDATGVRSIDGAPLEKEYVFAFTAGDPTKTSLADGGLDPTLVEAEKVVAARSAIKFCSTSPYCPVPTAGCTTPTPDKSVLGPNDHLTTCLAPGCHSPNKIAGPSGGVLALTSTAGGIPAAVKQMVADGTVATESATGPDPLVARRSPKDVFGQSMPVFDAHNPGNSFLLYKLILGMAPRCNHTNEESANPELGNISCTAAAGQLMADEFLCSDIRCMPEAGAPRPMVDGGAPGQAGQPAPPIVPGWVPDDRWQPPVAGEYDRLRSRIRGDGMPPPKYGTPSTYQSVRALSAWIANGAIVDCP